MECKRRVACCCLLAFEAQMSHCSHSWRTVGTDAVQQAGTSSFHLKLLVHVLGSDAIVGSERLRALDLIIWAAGTCLMIGLVTF